MKEKIEERRTHSYALRSRTSKASSSKPTGVSEQKSSDNTEVSEPRQNAILIDLESSIDENTTLLEMTKKLEINKDDRLTKSQKEPSSVKQDLEGNKDGVSSYWFLLVPKKDRNVQEYPPLQKPHIRLKNKIMPLSVISKFLRQKLNLDDKSQINLECHGIKLSSGITVANVKDIWAFGIPNCNKEKAIWDISELEIKLEYYGKVKE